MIWTLAAWSLTALLTGAVVAAGPHLNGPERMALMCAALGIGFKLVTRPRRRVFLYTALWPGMNPQSFEGERRPDPSALPLVVRGIVEMAIAVAILEAGARLDLVPLARAGVAVVAMMILVHLGFFDLLAGAWRWTGFPVERICPSPWRSRSLAEFWGRRWNMAFHFLACRHIYRPLARRWGRGVALAAVFLFSGLAHELVISFPAGGGWGLPTLYFAIHGLLVWLEKRGVLKGRWITTAAAVLLPLPLLFHGPFLAKVVVPLVMP